MNAGILVWRSQWLKCILYIRFHVDLSIVPTTLFSFRFSFASIHKRCEVESVILTQSVRLPILAANPINSNAYNYQIDEIFSYLSVDFHLFSRCVAIFFGLH